MTILRCSLRENLPAEVAYALALYALAACALLLYLLLCQADANPVTYAHGTNPFTDLVALAAIPEPGLLALLGAGLVSVHLTRRCRCARSNVGRFESANSTQRRALIHA
jgi:hypothetical protein